MVRAKFQCNEIKLQVRFVYNPKVLEALGEGWQYDYSELEAKAKELGEPMQVSQPLPEVRLNPVYAGQDASEEDKAFWEATPNGKLEMKIDNPNAADFFEVGRQYYLTFEAA